MKNISASLAVVEAGGEDAGLVYSHHLGGHQAPAGVPVHLLRTHPRPEHKSQFFPNHPYFYLLINGHVEALEHYQTLIFSQLYCPSCPLVPWELKF